MSLRFDGKVVIVTGAGGGLGRTHALLFASRGAAVVVNDLGTGIKGEGAAAAPADKVVAEIRAAGGKAVANYDSVEFGEKIVQTALDNFGRIDIVINNAGILRDVSFSRMKDADWDIIDKVHLKGTYSVTKAAWKHMQTQGYGRIIMTSSAAGLYGNFGQANYSAAKYACVGFAKTLALEGAKKNIKVNVIAPVAGSRLTATVMPADMVESLKPEYVSPLVAYLCHESCSETGQVFELGAGWVAKLRWQRSQGYLKPVSSPITIEDVASNWDKIHDYSDSVYPTSSQDATMFLMNAIQNSDGPAPQLLQRPKGGPRAQPTAASVDVAAALAYEFPPSQYEITSEAIALYALGIGAASDPMDASELKFVYELDPNFVALPTMGVIFPSQQFANIMSVPGLSFNPMMLLHGEQYMEVRGPTPTSGKLHCTGRIKNIYDKGKGALVILESLTKDDQGNEVVYNTSGLFIRGIGGFGGDRGPATEAHDPPKRAPDAVFEEKTNPDQALLYRLSGDKNPLHADPAMAAMGGFTRPILHGLCFFGYAGRAVLKHFCGNEPERFKSIQVRFAKSVYPGETLITEMWRVAPDKVVFRCLVKERNEVVLANAMCRIVPDGGAAASPSASPSATSGPKAALLFDALAAAVKDDPSLVPSSVKGVYEFSVKHADGVTTWHVDASANPAVVRKGPAAKADVSLSMSDADIVALAQGNLNPQQAFMQGKIKAKGNIMLATKLEGLFKTARSKGLVPSVTAASSLAAAPVFTQMAEAVKTQPDIAKKINAVYQFNIKGASESGVWTVDLKNGNTNIHEGAATAPECTIDVSDDDFVGLTTQKLNAQTLFMSGKLKVKGNMMLAMKLETLFKANAPSAAQSKL